MESFRMNAEPRFYRSQKESAIAGVASAISRVTGMPVLVARILFVIGIFVGPGLPLYLLIWFFSPKIMDDGRLVSAWGRVFAIGALMALPLIAVLLYEGVGIGEVPSVLLSGSTILGLAMLRRSRLAGLPAAYIETSFLDVAPDSSTLETDHVNSHLTERAVPEKMLAGVCSHLSMITGVNVQLIRLIVIVLSVIPATFPAVPIIYGASIFLVRREQTGRVHEA